MWVSGLVGKRIWDLAPKIVQDSSCATSLSTGPLRPAAYRDFTNIVEIARYRDTTARPLCLDSPTQMANRVLSPARDFVTAFRRTRIAYLQTHGAESVELAHLNTVNTEYIANADQKYSPASPSTSAVPDVQRRSSWNFSRKSTFTGWRFGALHFATWAAIVFTINIVVSIWGGVYQKAKGSLSEGDCGDIKNLNRGLHIFINILSTILLSGSNYCMQCLSAPTRTDIDRAHAKRLWLDIGVPSIRNLRHISRRRFWLWLLLGLSSVPLHLL